MIIHECNLITEAVAHWKIKLHLFKVALSCSKRIVHEEMEFIKKQYKNLARIDIDWNLKMLAQPFQVLMLCLENSPKNNNIVMVSDPWWNMFRYLQSLMEHFMYGLRHEVMTSAQNWPKTWSSKLFLSFLVLEFCFCQIILFSLGLVRWWTADFKQYPWYSPLWLVLDPANRKAFSSSVVRASALEFGGSWVGVSPGSRNFFWAFWC